MTLCTDHMRSRATTTGPWLTAWSSYFDGLSGPEFKAERRAVIEATFARFREICGKYEELRAS